MCGLVGVAGNLTYKDKEVFKNLMVVSSLRGEDSAGVAFVPLNRPEEAEVVKAVGSPYDLFAIKKFDTGFHDKQAAIGHTRKATVGGIHRHTAHPFEAGDIVGVHNGTLRNWQRAYNDLDKDFAKYFNTDSETLINAIAEFGVKEVIERTDGAYALIWFDKEKETLNFLRNEERTLWYAYSEKQDIVYWASEYRMLDLCLSRTDTKLHTNEEGHKYFSVPANLWIQLKTSNTGANGKIEILASEKIEGNVKKQSNISFPPYQAGPNVWRSAWNRDQFWESNLDDDLPEVHVKPKADPIQGIPPAITEKAAELTSTNTNTTPEKNILSLPFRPSNNSNSSQLDNKNESCESLDNPVLGHKGQELEETTFDNSTKHGCAWCQTSVTYDEAKKGGIGKWLSRDTFLCGTCYPPKPVGVGTNVRNILKAKVGKIVCN